MTRAARPMRPAEIRYYFDANVLGLGKILADTRNDTTYPGDPDGSVKGRRYRLPCPITDPETDDDIWIPETARQGWLIITRDRAIQDNRREIEAVRASRARMVTLAGGEAVGTFQQLEAGPVTGRGPGARRPGCAARSRIPAQSADARSPRPAPAASRTPGGAPPR